MKIPPCICPADHPAPHGYLHHFCLTGKWYMSLLISIFWRLSYFGRCMHGITTGKCTLYKTEVSKTITALSLLSPTACYPLHMLLRIVRDHPRMHVSHKNQYVFQFWRSVVVGGCRKNNRLLSYPIPKTCARVSTILEVSFSNDGSLCRCTIIVLSHPELRSWQWAELRRSHIPSQHFLVGSQSSELTMGGVTPFTLSFSTLLSRLPIFGADNGRSYAVHTFLLNTS